MFRRLGANNAKSSSDCDCNSSSAGGSNRWLCVGCYPYLYAHANLYTDPHPNPYTH